MDRPDRPCPDCSDVPPVSRRQFLRTSAAVAAAGSLPLFATPKAAAAAPTKTSAAETAVKALYDTLTPEQKKVICFAWDHVDKDRGLLRTHVSNNWQITKPSITRGDFYTKKQQGIVHELGCHGAQGFFFGRPEPAAAATGRLADQAPR